MAKAKPNPAEQHARFLDMAEEIEADESATLDSAFGAIDTKHRPPMPVPKKRPKKRKKAAKAK